MFNKNISHISPPGWRTRDQLIKMYNGNAAVADSIILKKKQTGEYREHPDMPDDPAFCMYYVSCLEIHKLYMTILL